MRDAPGTVVLAVVALRRYYSVSEDGRGWTQATSRLDARRINHSKTRQRHYFGSTCGVPRPPQRMSSPRSGPIGA